MREGETRTSYTPVISMAYPQIRCLQMHKMRTSEYDMHTICIQYADKKEL
ncbi:MAG: hypothetical protein NZ878_06535 [SAR324 cluster bacterium]|nr:hypothetical protein [SAR324 cluster bacterium]